MTNNRWVNTAARIGAIAVAGSWGYGAAAQDASSVRQTKGIVAELEEVIVTARKVTERLQDAPVAVTTLSGSALEERGIRDLGEAAKLAPSVKFDSDGDVRAGVSIRGVGGSSDINAAPGVGMFVDGVYQPSSAYFTVPFFDVERMEFLKGPQGTLYGKNTMGGAINIISREPSDELGGAVSLEAASGSQKVGNGVINLPITSSLGNRTAVFFRKTDGLQDNKTTGGHASERDDIAVRSRFVYDPSTDFKSSLSLFYANLQSAPFAYSQTTAGLNHPIDNVTKNLNGKVLSIYKSANLTNSFDFGPAQVTALTSFDKGYVNTLIDADYISTPTLTAGGVSSRNTFAQELRLTDSADKDAHLHWVVGAYYANDRLHSTSLANANLGALFGGVRVLSDSQRSESGKTYAGFGQVTWVMDKFEFVAGARHDEEVRKNHTISNDGTPAVTFVPNPAPPPAAFPVGVVNYRLTTLDRKVTSKEWQPKVSVAYHFTPDVMGYGQVSRGFRAGGFNALTAPPEFNTYGPEVTTNYETGLKTELFNRRLRLNSAVFYTDYTDILQTDITFNGTTQTVVSRNGGKAKSYGFELDAAYQIIQDLSVAASYAYLNIKNEKIPLGAVRRQPSGFAPSTVTAQVDYRHSIGDEIVLGAHVNANYISRTPMAAEAELRDAHTVVDASLDFSFKDITLTVFGKNVFNEKYYNSYIPATSTISGTSALGLLNQPAQYGLRLSAAF